VNTVVCVSFNHTTTPFPILEQVSIDSTTASQVGEHLCELPSVTEAVVVATCNRTEVYFVGGVAAVDRAVALLAAHSALAPETLVRHADVMIGDDASLHLFRVAGGLESRLVGEAEILAQVRSSIARAVELHTAGTELSALFRRAVAAGRRARRFGTPMTRPSLAALASDRAGVTGADRVLVVGAGALARSLTTELLHRAVRVRVCARHPDRAVPMVAAATDAVPFDRLRSEVAVADVVVCATAARSPVIDAATIGPRDRPLTIVDLSMPRNVAPDVADRDGVRLIDLRQLTLGGAVATAAPTHELAVRTIEREHHEYRLWLAGRASGELIRDLHDHVRRVCDRAAHGVSGLDAPATDRLANEIAGKLLHTLTTTVKRSVADGDSAAIGLLADAFGLPNPEASVLRSAS